MYFRSLQMWDHLTSGDIERAKQSLSSRRAETNARHAEETKSLEAKQADEIHSLNAKEAEIELLNKLCNDFTREFVHPAGTSSDGAGATMTPLAETRSEEHTSEL